MYHLASMSQISLATEHGYFLSTGVIQVNMCSAGKLTKIFKPRVMKLRTRCRAFDGKAKVWSIDRRTCVATHTETDQALWSVKWLPKAGRNEGFATAGANRSISVYREATGAWYYSLSAGDSRVRHEVHCSMQMFSISFNAMIPAMGDSKAFWNSAAAICTCRLEIAI